jgi:hypothetical protein
MGDTMYIDTDQDEAPLGASDFLMSNAASTITFRQHIGTADALRTGSYSKTLTFTLSTTSP